MRLVDTLYPVLKLAVTFWQLSGDEVRASRYVLANGQIDKHGLAQLEFVAQHGAPRAKNTYIGVRTDFPQGPRMGENGTTETFFERFRVQYRFLRWFRNNSRWGAFWRALWNAWKK